MSVNPLWLLGKSEFMQTSDMIENWNQSDIPDFPNIFPIETKKVPLLGKIAAGQPIMGFTDKAIAIDLIIGILIFL